jgi:hypothetical protein
VDWHGPAVVFGCFAVIGVAGLWACVKVARFFAQVEIAAMLNAPPDPPAPPVCYPNGAPIADGDDVGL